MTEYIEVTRMFEFFIYGIVCGFVINFLEKEKFSFNYFLKMIIFGLLAEYSHHIVLWFELLKKENQSWVLTYSIAIACLIYFIWLWLFEEENRKRVYEFLFKFLENKTKK